MKQNLKKEIRQILDTTTALADGFGSDVKERMTDQFYSLFLSFAEECLPGRKSFGIILTNEGKEAMSPKEWEMKGFNVCLDKMRENIAKVKG